MARRRTSPYRDTPTCSTGLARQPQRRQSDAGPRDDPGDGRGRADVRVRSRRPRSRPHLRAILRCDGSIRPAPGLHLPTDTADQVAMTLTIDLDSARLDDDGAPAWAGRRPDGGGVRLVWASEETGPGFAARWWPRSRDAVRELRKLMPVVSEHLGGPVTRVSLNIDAWGPDHPRRRRREHRAGHRPRRSG